MAENDERKATDILLELEHKVDLLLGLFKNINFNQQLMIAKLQNNNTNPAVIVAAPSSPPKAEGTVEAFDSSKIQKTPKPKASPSLSSPPHPSIPVETPIFPSVKTDKAKKPVKDGIKVSVQQKIIYSDGKSVILANVEVFNEDGEMVKKTRSDSAGKWKSVLNPGKYTVHVVSRSIQDHPKFEVRAPFEVPVQEEVLELETIKGN